MVGGWGYGFSHFDVGEAMSEKFGTHPLSPFIHSGTVAHG